MSNLYKSNRIVYKYDEVRVIETNELFSKKLQHLSGMISNNAQEEEKNGIVSTQESETDSTNALFEEGIIMKEVMVPIDEGPSPEDLIEQAQEEIKIMKDAAQEDIKVSMQEAIASGKEQGLREGKERADQELNRQIASNEAVLQQKLEEIRSYYEQKITEIEPLLIETLTDIYEHIFKVDLNSKKELISYLISNTLREIEGSQEFLIHVSREDYAFVISQREELQIGLVANARVEYIEDGTLKLGDCFIEAEGGIYDCGVDAQLGELKKELKLLSYTKS